MNISISSRGIWEYRVPITFEELEMQQRCRRDTKLDKEFHSSIGEGHKPCLSPDKYRGLTELEKEEMKAILCF